MSNLQWSPCLLTPMTRALPMWMQLRNGGTPILSSSKLSTENINWFNAYQMLCKAIYYPSLSGRKWRDVWENRRRSFKGFVARYFSVLDIGRKFFYHQHLNSLLYSLHSSLANFVHHHNHPFFKRPAFNWNWMRIKRTSDLLLTTLMWYKNVLGFQTLFAPWFGLKTNV